MAEGTDLTRALVRAGKTWPPLSMTEINNYLGPGADDEEEDQQCPRSFQCCLVLVPPLLKETKSLPLPILQCLSLAEKLLDFQ